MTSANKPQSELEKALEFLATDTWERLSDIKAFSQRPVPFNLVRLGETTITDLAMMYLCRRQVSESLFLQTPQHIERKHGTDFEWWIGSPKDGWFRLAVQAKKLNVREDRYRGLTQKTAGGALQISVLLKYAQENRATPLYCLYNFSDPVVASLHWHCCQRPVVANELGCSITPARRIQQAINRPGDKTFDFVHRCRNTLPWQCLASCPGAMQALSEGRSPSSPPPFPLFDAESFHPALPPFRPIPGDVGLDHDVQNDDISQSLGEYKLQAVQLDEIDDYYAPEVGFPRSILVTELESN